MESPSPSKSNNWLLEIREARKQWENIFKILKGGKKLKQESYTIFLKLKQRFSQINKLVSC